MRELTNRRSGADTSAAAEEEPTRRRGIVISRAAAFSIICGFVFVTASVALWFGWAVLYSAQSGTRFGSGTKRRVLAVAGLLPLMRTGALDFIAYVKGEPTPLLVDASRFDSRHKESHFPWAADPGYLLLSHASRDAGQSVVSLIRISDGKQLARWRPDIQALNRRKNAGRDDDLTKLRTRAFNPVLMPNGDVVYGTREGMLVRQGVCGNIVWALDDTFHHSVELDGEGNIWAPSVVSDPLTESPWLNQTIRDDAMTEISPDGRKLGVWSFSRILIANDLRGLFLGHSGESVPVDPIHMNDIQPAMSTSKYWNKGDLLISSRHMSTVFLYRPETGRIIWYKTGPWLNQHDVNFLGDSQITVFGDDIVGVGSEGAEFLSPQNSNEVYVYDFATDKISTPFSSLLREQHVRTMTEGRAEVLSDGGLFVEETNYGRVLRFSKDCLLWSKVNWYDEKRVGMVSWSRYLYEADVREPLKSIAAEHCGSN